MYDAQIAYTIYETVTELHTPGRMIYSYIE